MIVATQPPAHLTYCLNIHPGEDWDDNFTAIAAKATQVRRLVAPDKEFGLGLRLSAQAARQLRTGRRIEDFRRFMGEHGLYAFTINGFPFGAFHDTEVKAQVYAPDWRDPARLEYTVMLAEILAEVLPDGVPGSISTVPCSYKSWIRTPVGPRQMAEQLADLAMRLAEIRDRTGKDICLGLEPEPDCFIETTDEAIAFFNGPLDEFGRAMLKRRFGLDYVTAGQVLRRHVGVCFDTAHAAVEFEDMPAALGRLAEANVRVCKVQLSAALSLAPTPEGLSRLEPFVDRVYLHQVKALRADGEIVSYNDLPAALAAARGGCEDVEWRVHFHVPLFFDQHQGLRSTSFLLGRDVIAAAACPNLEIETYTFNVLPEFLRLADVTDSIAREYQWVMGNLL